MRTRFEVNREVIEETKHCQYKFKCLDGGFPICHATQGVEWLLCHPKIYGFCYYKFEATITTPLCMCPVKREIYTKYRSRLEE